MKRETGQTSVWVNGWTDERDTARERQDNRETTQEGDRAINDIRTL